jgi:hypothetical protein
MRGTGKLTLIAVLCAALLALVSASTAWAAASDPLFVFIPFPQPRGQGEPPPPPKPPPTSYLEGPCGVAAGGNGFYVSDYYHAAVDYFTEANVLEPWKGYKSQIAEEDPVDGPCGLALDGSAQHLYVNNFHRNVMAFPVNGNVFGTGTEVAGVGIDGTHPTGVAVASGTGRIYVNQRTYVSVYEPNGDPVLDGEGHPLRIGEGNLVDGYGVAVNGARVFVPDAATKKVKVYEPSVDVKTPVTSISGPGSGFSSLDDTAIAVDVSSGKIYVVDNLQPKLIEKPEAQVDVFSAAGTYLGRLLYNIIDAEPPGLTVDNSATSTQGQVYVTSGSSAQAGVYGYGPNAETAFGKPATFSLSVGSVGSGAGVVTSSPAQGIECSGSCVGQVRAGAEVTLDAKAGPGSSFAGWSGGGCTGAARCAVEMDRARSVHAEFRAEEPTASASTKTINQVGTLLVSLKGKLSPHRLPREGKAPISVSVGWQIETTDQSPPPKLKSLQIEINRNGRFDTAGLPVCPLAKIQPASTARALANCRAALVGRGAFSALVSLGEQESYAAGGRLLVFNGESHGKPVLYGQIYSAHPFATSFVIPFSVKELPKSRYGTVLSATLPRALRNWGNLTGIEMTLSRHYGFEGKPHSYLSAGCPAPKGFSAAPFPLARATFAFSGAQSVTSTLTEQCKVRP